MMNVHETSSKVEVIFKGTLSQPALVRIDQQEYVAHEQDPNTIFVLENVARGLLLRDLPTGLGLTPCKRAHSLDDLDMDLEIPITPSRFEGIAPFRIYHMGNGRAGIIFSWHCTKCFWNNESGYRWKLERARTAVLARRKSLSHIRFHRFIDNGYLAGVEFAVAIKCVSLESVIESAYEISEKLYSTIEDSLKRGTEKGESESAFIQDTFIPLLKNMGFRNVMFHHGPREFGRDVLFSRQTEFGIPEYWAAQAKLGNVSGKSNSYIDLIVNQAQEAFKIPMHDIQTKSKYWISKFVVVITGRYTENAVQKICEKIESHSLRNNIIFLDGEKIQELIRGVHSQQKHRKTRPRLQAQDRKKKVVSGPRRLTRD